MSAAGRERREEDQRRRQRKEDVVIGKTSALRDATDYALNPKATEEEWMRQASRVEQQIFRLTEDGMEALKMVSFVVLLFEFGLFHPLHLFLTFHFLPFPAPQLQIEDASAAFDKVFELKPNAYLWQAGMVKFYLDDLEGAADLFARNAAVYESKFGGQASEERIWRHACELKIASVMGKKGTKDILAYIDDIRSTLVPMPVIDEDPDSLFAESRKVFRIARDLFAASINNDQSGIILARAKLRSIGGNFDKIPQSDLKMWKLNAWFYLGLHYDAIGEIGESKECMKMALRNCPNAGHGADIVHALPLLHMSQRDWFDDDDMDDDPLELLRASPGKEFDDDNDEELEDDSTIIAGPDTVDVDPLVSDSIRKSIAKMRLLELQDALKTRGIKAHGAKKELQNRLYRSLLHDTGFHT